MLTCPSRARAIPFAMNVALADDALCVHDATRPTRLEFCPSSRDSERANCWMAALFPKRSERLEKNALVSPIETTTIRPRYERLRR
jgi:hypothetical protein